MDRSIFSAALTVSHAAALVIVLAWGLWPLRRDRGIFLCGLFVLLWADLVGTGLLLASVSRLGDRIDYVLVSIALAMVLAMIRRPLSATATASLVDVRSGSGSASDVLIRGACWLAIAAVTIAAGMLVLGADPDNYDSVAYRLPRALLYIGQGTLAHPPGGDFRMQFYPFDIALGYAAMAIHGLAGRWTNLLGFGTWLVGGVAVERWARTCGAGKTAALVASTLFMTAPAVLVSANSGNDDLMAGVPLVIGLMFAVRWWRNPNFAEVALAAMGFGLSAGSKLHLPFLVPVAALFSMSVLFRLVVGGQFRRTLRERAIHIALAAAVFAPLVLPAFLINEREAGHLTPTLANFQNSPFSARTAAVNTALFSANMLISPIPDLNLDPSVDRRKAFYESFNGWFNRHLFTWVSSSLNYSNEPYYRFEGVASADAYEGVWEQSAWLGFVPWLLLAVPICAYFTRGTGGDERSDALRRSALWLTAAFFGWHLARTFSLKYIGGAGIYYAFIVGSAAPALAWLWEAARSSGLKRLGLRASCLAVLATNLVADGNAFAFNPQRNIRGLLANEALSFRQPVVESALAAALRASKRTLIAYTQWEEPLFDLMSVQPRARYALAGTALPAGAVPGYDLSFLLDRVRSDYGELPLHFDHDDRSRLALLGTMGSVFGPQRAFGHGDPLPPPAASTVAEYAAASNAGSLRPTAGWSPTEHTHRWSDGASSALDFVLPAGATSCALDLTAITLGPQHVTATLNGDAAGAFDLDTWFPGRDVALHLPDASLIPGRTNHLVLGYDAPRKPNGEGRALALGLVKAAVACRPGGGPDRRAVFDYRASDDAGSAALTRGWSPTERTHRWSNAAESDIDFRLPVGRRSCALDAKAITAGRQTVSTSLNGAPVGETTLESWFPGGDLHVDFPDGDLRPGEVNRIAFRFAATQTVQGRDLALGLVDATVRCRIDDTGEVDLLPPARDGFAVLGLDQRRDARGALTALSPGRLNGVDPDEAFDIRLELVSPAGDVRPVSDWGPVAWSTWIELPSAPVAGSVHVELRRRDRSDIAASVYMPAAAGQDLGLDLRSPPPGVGSSF